MTASSFVAGDAGKYRNDGLYSLCITIYLYLFERCSSEFIPADTREI